MESVGSTEMRVLIINHNGGSPYHGPNLRTYYAGKKLVDAGCTVTALSASYSHKYAAPPEASEDFTRETIDGINYIWVRTIVYRSLFQRICSHFQYGIKIARHAHALVIEADVVLFSSPPPEIFPFARSIARRLNAPIVSDIRDFWPLTQVEMSRMYWVNPYTYFLYLVQYHMFRASDVLVSSLPGADRYVTKITPRAHCEIIENGFDVSAQDNRDPGDLRVLGGGLAFGDTETGTVSLRQLRDMARFVVGYSGSFDRANDVGSFLACAERMAERDDIAFILLGSGRLLDEVLERAKELPNALVLGRVPSTAVPGVLECFDACYCGLHKKATYQYGVSLAKSFEYMAAAKPVIWMVDACNNPIEASGGGVSVPPSDLDALQRAVEHLARMSPAEREEMGKKNRAYLMTNNSYDILGKKWLSILKRVVIDARA